ncbi:MAG: hypothetical protein WBZ36_25605 [Candidatus Nitrosopolaris sp.]
MQRQIDNCIRGQHIEMQKNFMHLRSFEDKPNYPNSKPKVCVTCGIKATQEASFNVGDGVILVEKYCDVCAKNVK